MVKGKRRKERKILPKSSILDEISDLKGEERNSNGQLDREIIGSFEIRLLLSRGVLIFIPMAR